MIRTSHFMQEGSTRSERRTLRRRANTWHSGRNRADANDADASSSSSAHTSLNPLPRKASSSKDQLHANSPRTPSAQHVATMAKEMKLDLFRQWTLDDFIDQKHAHRVATLEQFNYDVNRIKAKIIKGKTKGIQLGYLQFYYQYLKESLKLCDYQTSFNVYLALVSPEVSRLLKDLKKRHPKIIKKATEIFQLGNGYKAYNKHVKKHAKSIYVPWLQPYITWANSANETSGENAQNILFQTFCQAIGKEEVGQSKARKLERPPSVVLMKTPRESSVDEEVALLDARLSSLSVEGDSWEDEESDVVIVPPGGYYIYASRADRDTSCASDSEEVESIRQKSRFK